MTLTASLLLDVVMLVLLVSYLIHGWRRGLILSLCSLLAAVLGLAGGWVLADRYAAPLLEWMEGPLAPAGAGAILPVLLFLAGFLGTQALWSLLCHALHLVAKLPGLHFLNKALGALLGLGTGVVVLAVALWLLGAALGWIPAEVLAGSHLLDCLAGLSLQLPLSW